MTTIKETLEIVRQLAAGAPEPELLCWLSHDDEGEHYTSYCRPCAGKIKAWLVGGEKPEQITQHQEHPTWKNCTQGSVNIHNAGYGYETEGCEHCELCGAHLSVSLLKYGVESELDHFEAVIDSEFTPGDWRHILDVLEGIEYVESDWATPGEDERKLYNRAIALVEAKLPVERTK